MCLQEAEEAAAAEVLKLQQELGMEEAGLQPHPEEDEDAADEATANDADNQVSKEVPEDEQSYQLYVQALKPGCSTADNKATYYEDDANNQGAADQDNAEDNNTLLSEDDSSNSASDNYPLRRRRVSFFFQWTIWASFNYSW